MNAANAVVMALMKVLVTVMETLQTVPVNVAGLPRKIVPVFAVAQQKTAPTGRMILVHMSLWQLW
jgi:hypothetical protein